MLKIAYQRYKIYGDIYVDTQGRVFTILFYFTIMVPFGIGARLFGDLLELKRDVEWLERPAVSDALEEAQRQG